MKKNVMKGFFVILVVFVILAGQGNLHARLVLNQVEAFFDIPGGTTIRSLVIESAGYFLKAYSDILSLSDRIEMSDLNGIDYSEARLVADKAIFNLENAREKYMVLNQIAANIRYNPVLINHLRVFNYSEFGDRQLLAGRQFERVTYFLRKGDIRGLFMKVLNDVENILAKLDRVRFSLNSQALPEMSDIWDLNRFCSEFMLFGQYSARIFYRITGK